MNSSIPSDEAYTQFVDLSKQFGKLSQSPSQSKIVMLFSSSINVFRPGKENGGEGLSRAARVNRQVSDVVKGINTLATHLLHAEGRPSMELINAGAKCLQDVRDFQSKLQKQKQDDPQIRELEQTLVSLSEKWTVKQKLDKSVESGFRDSLLHFRQLKATLTPRFRDGYHALLEQGNAMEREIPTDPQQRTAFFKESQQRFAKFEQDVASYENLLLGDFCTDLDVTRNIGERIFEGAQNNWKGFVDDTGKQIHGIPGLKVYKDQDTGLLVADYRLGELGKGSYKKAIWGRRIGGEEFVRLSSVTKAKEKQLREAISQETDRTRRAELEQELKDLQEEYLADIQSEFAARQLLAGIPNVAKMTKIEYINKEGVLKTRYIMTKYEGDLWKLAITKKDRERARKCCPGVFRCVSRIHARGLVHTDLKTLNVLFSGDEGFVSDYGNLSKAGASFPFAAGTLVYMAPETFFAPKKNPCNATMDMFSLGIFLLSIEEPDLYLKWQADMNALESNEKLTTQEKNATYQGYLAGLQTRLQQSSSPYKDLINKLISYNPADRPTCLEALSQIDLALALQTAAQIFASKGETLEVTGEKGSVAMRTITYNGSPYIAIVRPKSIDPDNKEGILISLSDPKKILVGKPPKEVSQLSADQKAFLQSVMRSLGHCALLPSEKQPIPASIQSRLQAQITAPITSIVPYKTSRVKGYIVRCEQPDVPRPQEWWDVFLDKENKVKPLGTFFVPESS